VPGLIFRTSPLKIATCPVDYHRQSNSGRRQWRGDATCADTCVAKARTVKFEAPTSIFAEIVRPRH
jgi:hypothetical protein